MQLWMKRIFVTFISIVTLGLYVPPMQIHTDAEASNKEVKPSDESTHNETMEVVLETNNHKFAPEPLYDSTTDRLIEQAKLQTVTKLGPKISNQIDDDIETDILPGIESVLQTLLDELPEKEINQLRISEEKAAGYGEKIFDVYNEETGKDIIRFHVRRDNRPQEGYWFNFHYHTLSDNYEVHHNIGEIFWSKDTPPKWMS